MTLSWSLTVICLVALLALAAFGPLAVRANRNAVRKVLKRALAEQEALKKRVEDELALARRAMIEAGVSVTAEKGTDPTLSQEDQTPLSPAASEVSKLYGHLTHSPTGAKLRERLSYRDLYTSTSRYHFGLIGVPGHLPPDTIAGASHLQSSLRDFTHSAAAESQDDWVARYRVLKHLLEEIQAQVEQRQSELEQRQHGPYWSKMKLTPARS